MQKEPISPLMRELSAYISGSIRRPLPSEVMERAKVHLVDTFAAMISGSRLLPGKKALTYVKSLGGKPEAGLIGTRIVTSAVNAALGNGMFAHADETDDTHPASITHPGRNVVPAAFAIAERGRVSGAAVLRGVVIGYEVCTRMALALDPKPFERAGHYTGAYGGAFGAAAAASALLDLSANDVRYVISYAAQQVAGLISALRDSQHVEKAFAAGGMPAHNGTAAALMVKHGFTGVEDVFSGERNFFFTFAPNADHAQLTRGLGRDYEILRCAIKCWSSGGPTQGPLHVLREMIRQYGIKPDDVEMLVAYMPDKELEVVNDRDMPNISVQHLLAVMLLDGTTTFAATHDLLRMKDPAVLALRRRIRAIGDPSLTDTLRRWRCVMEITLKNGRKLTHQTMAAKGSYENPVSRAEEEEKALDLIAPVLGKRRTQALITALWNVEHITDVRALRELYTK